MNAVGETVYHVATNKSEIKIFAELSMPIEHEFEMELDDEEDRAATKSKVWKKQKQNPFKHNLSFPHHIKQQKKKHGGAQSSEYSQFIQRKQSS